MSHKGCNMATDANNKSHSLSFYNKNDRDFMNKLRDSGQEYLTQSGKLIPAKTQPVVYCYCPQFCQRKLPRAKWDELFQQFYSLADQKKQNMFLKTHISCFTHNSLRGKQHQLAKKRIVCKYMVPQLKPGQHINEFLEKTCPDAITVCQKAFVNAFGISEKRIRMQRQSIMAQSDELDEISVSSKDQEMDNEPLDLSNHSNRNTIELGKKQLYELAESLGITRAIFDQEFIEKCQKKLNMKEKKKIIKRDFLGASLRGISEQVVGLEDNLAILPMQTLNNGDLTITPLLGPVAVKNQDIMTVNLFFQNQLWRPELIGLHVKSESPMFI